MPTESVRFAAEHDARNLRGRETMIFQHYSVQWLHSELDC